MNIFNPNLGMLKDAADLLRRNEQGTERQLSDEDIDRLMPYVLRWYGDDDYSDLFDRPYVSACGCMGPMNDEPFCPCMMRHYVFEYRYDIALRLLTLRKSQY